jgi:hypothetical protein
MTRLLAVSISAIYEDAHAQPFAALESISPTDIGLSKTCTRFTYTSSFQHFKLVLTLILRGVRVGFLINISQF